MIEINECRETIIYQADEDICIKQFSEDCEQSVTVYIPLDRAQDVAAAIIRTLLESPSRNLLR